VAACWSFVLERKLGVFFLVFPVPVSTDDVTLMKWVAYGGTERSVRHP
jgi:hypothetical protein